MTKKKALQTLKEHTRHYISIYDCEALEVAIRALEREVAAEEEGVGTNDQSTTPGV